MSKNVKLTHLRSRLSLEVDWVWAHQPKDYTKPRQTIQSLKRLYKDIKYQTRPDHIRQTKIIRAPKGPGSGPPPHYQEYPPNSSILELTPRKLVHSALNRVSRRFRKIDVFEKSKDMYL